MLINNATSPVSDIRSTTEDGLEAMFGIDHVGHFLLSNLLIPKLAETTTADWNPRVVTVSSRAHTRFPIRWDDLNFTEPGSYSKWPAYSQAKSCNILFAKEAAKRYSESTGVLFFSLHPGRKSIFISLKISRSAAHIYDLFLKRSRQILSTISLKKTRLLLPLIRSSLRASRPDPLLTFVRRSIPRSRRTMGNTYMTTLMSTRRKLLLMLLIR